LSGSASAVGSPYSEYRIDLFSAHRGTATAIKAKQQEIIMVGSEVTTDAARQSLKVM